MKEKNTILKIKRTDFLGMWKDFFNPEPTKKTQEEEILDSNESQEVKKQLLKSLEKNNNFQKELFRNSYKTARLEVKEYKKTEKIQMKENGIPQNKTKIGKKSIDNDMEK